MCIDLPPESALLKFSFSEIPATGGENYIYLQEVREQEKSQLLKDFLRWRLNKDVVPTLSAVKKKVDFYDSEVNDFRELVCTLPINLDHIFLHRCTIAKFCRVTRNDKDLF